VSMFRRLVPFFVAIATLCVCCASASAVPGWGLDALTRPSHLRPGGRGIILIRVLNDGPSASEGTVTVTDVLPPGVTALAAGAHSIAVGGPEKVGPEELYEASGDEWLCSGNGSAEGGVAGATVVTCVNNPLVIPSLTGGGGTPTEWEPSIPQEGPEIGINVQAPATEGEIGQRNKVTVVGGGALNATTTSNPVIVSKTPAPFGFEKNDAWFTNENGTTDTQAGSHPYMVTFISDFNTTAQGDGFGAESPAGGEARNITVNLPPGLIGNTIAVPRCTFEQFNNAACPPGTQVGLLASEAVGGGFYGSGGVGSAGAVYNLVPPAGEPAQFGFILAGIPTLLGTVVRSGSNYALQSRVNDVPQRGVIGNVLTLWGVPSNPSHDLWRPSKASTNLPEVAFVTSPVSCEGPQEITAKMNSWEHPNEYANSSFLTHDANNTPVGFTGCESLGFNQKLTAAPDTSNADTPGGVTAGIESAVGQLEVPGGLSDTDLKHVTFSLPPGIAINPGQGAGLEACSFADSGIGVESTSVEPFKGEPHCPNASKVGTDEAELPILAHPVRGNIYVLPSEPPHLLLLFALSGEGRSRRSHAERIEGALGAAAGASDQLPRIVRWRAAGSALEPHQMRDLSGRSGIDSVGVAVRGTELPGERHLDRTWCGWRIMSTDAVALHA
jgi:hypothetical protein